MNKTIEAKNPIESTNFIRNIIEEDLKQGKNNSKLITRFPPEPNGYLHIGHAKAICLNFGLAERYKAQCNLRFDDTNPIKEETFYVDAIKEDIKWLGFTWSGKELYASDYFEKLYDFAVKLISLGKAYVCDLSPEKIREYRGTLTEAGQESPSRNRPIKENQDLFERMRKGEFEDGKYLLRAKIDMSAGNINMRDPAIFRIRRAHHHRTGDKWCIYPMYDFAHSLSDAIENITHSLCTLEFQDHRPLYDWFVNLLIPAPQPKQYEFSRLNLEYTVTSKRKLKELVDLKLISGWDDPRMPTLIGMRRRGYPAKAIKNFCEKIGVSKKESTIDMSILEELIREHLNESAPRQLAVLKPLKVVISNYPEDKIETFDVPVHPQDPSFGRRNLCFAKEIFIEENDFMENPPKNYHRLSPGKEVRLRFSYTILCEKVIKDSAGKVIEIHCTYDPKTKGKKPEGRKVKGIIHWIAKENSKTAKVNLYERLFSVANPLAAASKKQDFKDFLNPKSLEIAKEARIEKNLLSEKNSQAYQFERLGYFCFDQSSTQNNPLLNRIVTLRDTWLKKP